MRAVSENKKTPLAYSAKDDCSRYHLNSGSNPALKAVNAGRRLNLMKFFDLKARKHVHDLSLPARTTRRISAKASVITTLVHRFETILPRSFQKTNEFLRKVFSSDG